MKGKLKCGEKMKSIIVYVVRNLQRFNIPIYTKYDPVYVSVLELFDGNEHVAKTWMKHDLVGLGNVSPFSIIHTKKGRKRILELIGRIENGVFY